MALAEVVCWPWEQHGCCVLWWIQAACLDSDAPRRGSGESQPAVTAQESNGLVSVDGTHDVQETVNRCRAAMEERALTVMTTIDHAANAVNVGMELRPTQLIIFGNPKLGTQLMQSRQSVAIDLPKEFWVWEDAEGQVHMTYNNPRIWLIARDHTFGTICPPQLQHVSHGLAEDANTP